jgi:hypothetical protein
LVDLLIDAKKLERLDDRGPIFEIANLDFPLSDLLTHLPFQRWPLPHMNTCPRSFCDETIEPRSIDTHLELMPGEFFQRGLHYSEVQLRIAGVLGIHLNAARRREWRGPFSHYTETIQTFSDICDHVFMEHKSQEKELYGYVEGFWAAIPSFYIACFRMPRPEIRASCPCRLKSCD